VLVPYWARRLGRNALHARQLSKRGGELFCELKGDRVLIAGKAVKVIEGRMFL
jgi:predicted PhzF superfamily epimerase YddE/YHI9